MRKLGYLLVSSAILGCGSTAPRSGTSEASGGGGSSAVTMNGGAPSGGQSSGGNGTGGSSAAVGSIDADSTFVSVAQGGVYCHLLTNYKRPTC